MINNIFKQLFVMVLLSSTLFTETKLTQTEVSMLYVSIFNRASEGEGNKYWQNSNLSMKDVAKSMLETDDAKEYFGNSLNSNQAFVEHIYKNTLNKTRDDDPEGIDYWTSLLDNGTSRSEMISSFINSINTYSNTTDPNTKSSYKRFMNRVKVSNYMANSIKENPDDYKITTSFSTNLSIVNDNPNSIDLAKDIINGIITRSSSNNNQHGTGLIFSSKESLEEIKVATPPAVYGSNSLPKSFDLSYLMPPVRDQGSQGSCVAWAVGYYLKSYHEHIEKNIPYGQKNDHSGTFSPAFLYNITKIDGCNDGSYFKDNFERLKNIGISSWKDMPYNQNDCDTLPSQKAIKNAKCAKILEYEILNISNPLKTIDLMDIKNYLVKKEPVIIGITIYEGFDSPQKINGEYFYKNFNKKNSRGAHAITVVGYDDHRNAFKIVNSWGKNWANSGYLWIDYEVFKKIVHVVYIAHDANNSCEEDSAYLSIDKTSLIFGDKKINQYYQKKFTLSNIGIADIYIREIILPEGYSVNWKNGTIQAGTKQSVEVTFRPTEKKQYNGIILIKHDANNKNSKINLIGAGIIEQNQVPIANAGTDISVKIGNSVILDASGSYDSDGNIVSYEWTEGNTIISRSKTFQKNNFSLGIHRITLKVTDNDGASSTDTVIVTIKTDNKLPIANAGDDITVTIGSEIKLDASNSYDPDGTISMYQWKKGRKILSLNKVYTTKSFPVGRHEITLYVTDDDGASSTDTVIVTIKTDNKLPIANAGDDITVTIGSEIKLDASNSYDPDGTISMYQWKKGRKILSLNKVYTTKSFPVGRHEITLYVTDDDGAISTDTMIITVNDKKVGNKWMALKSKPIFSVKEEEVQSKTVANFVIVSYNPKPIRPQAYTIYMQDEKGVKSIIKSGKVMLDQERWVEVKLPIGTKAGVYKVWGTVEVDSKESNIQDNTSKIATITVVKTKPNPLKLFAVPLYTNESKISFYLLADDFGTLVINGKQTNINLGNVIKKVEIDADGEFYNLQINVNGKLSDPVSFRLYKNFNINLIDQKLYLKAKYGSNAGKYMLLYRLDIDKKIQLIIDMEAEDFDTYLSVTDMKLTPLYQDDNGGSGTNSKLEDILLDKGSYYIEATTSKKGVKGLFNLSIIGIEVPIDTDTELTDEVYLSIDSTFTIYRTGKIGDRLTWVIEKDGEIVLERNARNELQYKYFGNNYSHGSKFRVWVEKFINGEYKRVSNIVEYQSK